MCSRPNTDELESGLCWARSEPVRSGAVVEMNQPCFCLVAVVCKVGANNLCKEVYCSLVYEEAARVLYNGRYLALLPYKATVASDAK